MTEHISITNPYMLSLNQEVQFIEQCFEINTTYIASPTKSNNTIETFEKLQDQPPHSMKLTMMSTLSTVWIFGHELTTQDIVRFTTACWADQMATPPLLFKPIKPHPVLPVGLELTLSFELSERFIQRIKQKLQIELIQYNRPRPTLAKPGLLVMDMDSTAITIECIDAMATRAGVGNEVAAITQQAMAQGMDFTDSLKKRLNILAGSDASIIHDVIYHDLQFTPGLESLVKRLKQHNWSVVIASGGFTHFTEYLQRRLVLDEAFANQLQIIDGRITGQVLGEIVTAEFKAEILQKLAQNYGIPLEQTVAIGDGMNDLPMLKTANMGVAFHAKPALAEQIPLNITHGGLDQLLYLLN